VKSDATAIRTDDGFYLDRYSKTKPKMTTRGWKLLVEWKDGNMSWVTLKDMKESFPIETAEYAVANKIVHEPAFAWWVPETLRRRHHIIEKVKSKYWKRTHKFGIRLPHSVDEALRITRKRGPNIGKMRSRRK
jgi:hypothetical protein